MEKFHKEYLGIKPSGIVTNNRGKETVEPVLLPIIDESIDSTRDMEARVGDIPLHRHEWKSDLPRPIDLYRDKFGQPDQSHSFTQGVCAETTFHFVLKSGFLSEEDTRAVHKTHPLLAHLDRVRDALSDYDFTWIRNIDTSWQEQK